MLEGKKVNLRIIEKEDLELYAKWINDCKFGGEFAFFRQRSRTEIEKRYSERSPDDGTFIIEKKDGTKIGLIPHFTFKFGGYTPLTEIGYFLVPSERGKGYSTEAVGIVLDYLFLLNEIPRIQAVIIERNIASKRVLEKNGFMKEGKIRKFWFVRGEYEDGVLFSILREEWGGPNILR